MMMMYFSILITFSFKYDDIQNEIMFCFPCLELKNPLIFQKEISQFIEKLILCLFDDE